MKKQARRTEQPKVRQRKNIAFRMNLLFFMIFVLFSILILRLGYLQIVKSDDYILALERKEEISVNTSVPRGRIFDRDGRILVDNEPKNAITYTKLSSTTSEEMLKVAKELAGLIEQDTKRTTPGDKKDFWILNNKEAAAKKVSKKEQSKITNDSSLSDTQKQKEINRLTRERITDNELESFSEDDLEVLAIYREMMSGYAFSPQIIKSEDVSPEEFAIVSERLSELPGVNTTTDWERVKRSSNTILGTTTNPTEGIPASHLDYYLARGYSRNDRVGKSFLEQEYEELLQGQKSIVKNIKDRTGVVVETKTVQEGEPGKDLVLTIDSELNEALEEIVSDKLLQLKAGPNSQALDRAFLVMMDPNNGEVLSLVGKQIIKNKDTGRNEIQDYSFGTFATRYEVGSTVKMGTLLAGYEHGGASIGEFKIDEPFKSKGTALKGSIFNRSLFNRISIGDIEAIGRSSNVYMFKTALAIGNGTYRYNESLSFDMSAFDKLRGTMNSLGLGTMTGIDLPGEVDGGQLGYERGKLLDLAIGQYDTYSPIQLAQYVSTIANGGYRIAPRVVREIREPSPDGKVLGALVEEKGPQVLNKINNSERELEQIHRGMLYTYYGNNGTARGLFADASYTAAGKTGTAESGVVVNNGTSEKGTFYKTVSLTHVGFAPYENPEIAYAVIIPHVSTTNKYKYANNEIARAAADKYFELKAKREKEAEEDGLQKIKEPLKDDDDENEEEDK